MIRIPLHRTGWNFDSGPPHYIEFCDSVLPDVVELPANCSAIDVCVTDKKPRGEHYFTLRKKHEFWHIVNDDEIADVSGTAYWLRSFDDLLTESHPKAKKLYGWIEY